MLPSLRLEIDTICLPCFPRVSLARNGSPAISVSQNSTKRKTKKKRRMSEESEGTESPAKTGDDPAPAKLLSPATNVANVPAIRVSNEHKTFPIYFGDSAI